MKYGKALWCNAILLAVPGLSVAEVKNSDDDKSALDLAEQMIETCQVNAAASGLPSFSIAIVDRGGVLLSLERQAGAAPVTADIAIKKAQTVLRIDGPTSELATMAAQDEGVRDTVVRLGLITLPGGLPFSSERYGFAGAIGVSGGSSEEDVSCAQIAIDSLSRN